MKKLIFVFLGFVLFACKADRPLDLLSEDEMVNLMIDIHLTQSELQVRNFKHEEAKLIFNKVLQDSIVVKRGWTMDQVQRSVDYYLDDVTSYSEVYERVLDSLTLRESLLRNKE